jgi:hypothetical protein
MLKQNPATKDKKTKTTRRIIGYTTYVLSRNWRGNNQVKGIMEGKIK